MMEGSAGTGKIFTYNESLNELDRQGVSYFATSFSGIASTLLRNGRTVHSAFKFPVPLLNGARCNISVNSRRAGLLLSVTGTFLHHRWSLNVTCTYLAWGWFHHFRQVLPIVRHSNPTAEIESKIKNLSVWPLLTKICLTQSQNMRTNEEEREFKLVTKVG